MKHPSLNQVSLLAIASVSLLSACSKQAAPKAEVLAKVGSAEIRAHDLKREAEWRLQHGRAATNKQALLDEMVLQEALLQRARKAGIDTDPQVQREVRNLIIGKLFDRQVDARQDTVSIRTDELRAEYERNLTKYTRAAKFRFSLLFLEADAKTTEAKRAQLKGRLQEARRLAATSPAPSGRGPAAQGFGAVAIDYSDDQASRYRGGDIGWLDAGATHSRWPRQLLEVAEALDKGQMSDVIETDAGLCVIMKTDAREASVTPFAHVEATLRQSLLVKRRQEIEKAFRREAVEQAGVTVNQKALAGIELKLPATAVAQNRQTEPPSIPGVGLSTRGN